MTTPPNANAVSDARLAEVRAWLDAAKMPGTPLALQADARAALEELQARRAADATREPAQGVVEALREMVARHPENTGARAAAVAALAAHDAAQAQRDPVQKLVTKSGCPFCNYAGPSVILRRYDSAVVFEPLKPVTPGHVIVVPTKHVEDVADDPIVTAEVMGCVARYIREEVGGACNVITSKGREATQSVFHLHVHIVPRRANDGLHLPWTTQSARDPVQAVLAEVAALVANLDGGPIARSTTANARHQIRQNNVRRAALEVALVLRLDREAAEKGDAP